MKNKSIILEECIAGNFTVGVGNENTDYTNKWIFHNTENVHLQIDNVGNNLYCVALQNTEEKLNFDITCNFLYDSQITCNVFIHDNNTEIITVSYDNNNKIWESYEDKIEDIVKKNNLLKFEITTKDIKKGDCLFTINFECVTQKTKQIAIPLEKFYKEYLSSK
jgi:hypothetical protein